MHVTEGREFQTTEQQFRKAVREERAWCAQGLQPRRLRLRLAD